MNTPELACDGESLPTIRIAAALIRNERGEVLLVRKRDTQAFMQPGGKLEPGESAAAALALDWSAVHKLLAASAERFGFAAPEPYIIGLPGIATVSPPLARALAFGAQQLLAQHRGLWDLLESRASARDAL